RPRTPTAAVRPDRSTRGSAGRRPAATTRTSERSEPYPFRRLSAVQPVSPPYAQPPRDPTEVLGRRFAALAIDLFVLGVIAFIFIGIAKHRSFYDAPANACEHVQNRGSSLCYQIGDRLYLWDRGAY